MTDLIPGDFSYVKKYVTDVNIGEFWIEALAQLNKDIGQVDAIIISQKQLHQENAAETIVNSLQKYLPSITPRLSEILYRIDLGEQFEASLKSLPAELYYRMLSEMVLRRIVQKVITRKVYNSGKL
jgi:hypothetical protein